MATVESVRTLIATFDAYEDEDFDRLAELYAEDVTQTGAEPAQGDCRNREGVARTARLPRHPVARPGRPRREGSPGSTPIAWETATPVRWLGCAWSPIRSRSPRTASCFARTMPGTVRARSSERCPSPTGNPGGS